MSNNRLGAVLAISTVAVLWGLSFLSIKIAVAVVPPMTLALARFVMASIILYPLLKWREPQTRLQRQDWFAMLMAGVSGVSAYFYFENNGVRLTTASTASIIIAAIPILTLIADYFVNGTRLTKPKVSGVLISLLGVYLVVGADWRELTASGQGLGYLMMFGAGASWVAYSLLTKPLGKRYSDLGLLCYQTLFGTATLLPFALLEMRRWAPVSGAVWLNITFLGIFCSALGYYLYIYALKGLGVAVVSVYINLIPVVTVIAGYFILGETLTPRQLTGGLLVLASVSVASWPGRVGQTDAVPQTVREMVPDSAAE